MVRRGAIRILGLAGAAGLLLLAVPAVFSATALAIAWLYKDPP